MIKGCGNATFESMEDACANIHKCEGLPLELESQFYSVNEEWDIHCERRYLEAARAPHCKCSGCDDWIAQFGSNLARHSEGKSRW
ncbi:hypothetical protein COOONC_02751 [Cooperia oncophora]